MKTLVLDTSPLIALYLGEPRAVWISEQIREADRLLMSTVNLTECLIILRLRNAAHFATLASRLLTSNVEFIAPDRDQAIIAADARERYPLNLGDCFAYALAKSQNVSLLTLDSDFRKTDIQVLLPSS